MKFNWNQTGMPASLVCRLGQRNEFAEIKSVLNDAGNHVMRTVDAESLAQELLKSGDREIVEMVRDLTTALANAERELESANRRYERLTADLARRGIVITEDFPSREQARRPEDASAGEPACGAAGTPRDEQAEWEDWDRKFQSLLG